jgi:broad specificity phosphatase PhoE
VSRLYLVRHGKAAAGWGADVDPGLDDTGRAQAEGMADAVAPLGPLSLITSPLRRTRETAAPLERRWNTEATIEPAVGEIESPTQSLTEREAWLRAVMQGSWRDAPDLGPWRKTVIEALAGIATDAVVVTHFVAINVAVGHATADDRVLCFMPDNCSVTTLEVDGDRFDLVDLGDQLGSTRVL